MITTFVLVLRQNVILSLLAVAAYVSYTGFFLL